MDELAAAAAVLGVASHSVAEAAMRTEWRSISSPPTNRPSASIMAAQASSVQQRTQWSLGLTELTVEGCSLH